MEVSRTQKISFKVICTLVICMLCLSFIAPTTAEAGFFKKAWGAVKSVANTACKVVTGLVKGAVDLVDTAVNGEEEPETVESAISFEDIGQTSSIYFSTNSSPDAETGDIPGVGALNETYQGGNTIYAGNAGVFVSYGGKSWLSSLLTMATTSSSYDTYKKIPISSTGSSTTNLVYDYACYGATLSTVGLDKTGYEVSTHFMSYIGGGLIYLLYMASTGLDSFFAIIFEVLMALNPFQLFYKGVNITAHGNAALQMSGYTGGTKAETIAGTAFSGLTTFLSKWYSALYNFSWEILVPIFFVVLVVAIVLFRHTGQWKSMLKKYIIRVAFLVIGVPLLGGIYTSALQKMSQAVSPGASPVTKLILSTFIDFESWAEHGRLSLNRCDNTTMKIVTSGNNKGVRVASGEAKLNVRNIAFQINKAYAVASADRTTLGDALFFDYGTTTNASSSNTQTASTHASVGFGDEEDIIHTTQTQTGYTPYGQVTYTVRKTNNRIVSLCTDILHRFMDGKYYTSGEYEALVKAQLTTWASADDKKGNNIILQFITIEDLASWYVAPEGESYESHQGRMTELNHFGTEIKRDESHGDLVIETQGNDSNSWNLNVYANGSLSHNNSNAAATGNYYDSGTFKEWGNSNLYSVKAGYGLSSCSMYNYLNTSFSSSSVTCYSPSNIASTFVRKSHYSVNVVGTGITSFLYWLNCFMMILCYVVVGYFYAVGMMFSNISRMFQVVKAIPFAMLGGIKSIAEVITYAIVMIIEVILTIFLFEVIIEIMFSIPDIFTGALAAAFESTSNDSMVNWGMPVILLFLAFFYGWFMCKALKMRKTFVKSLSEGAEAIVDKFIGVNTNVVGSGEQGANAGKGIIGGALGGAALGAGAAIAGNALTKDAAANEDGNPDGSGGNLSDNGPDGDGGPGTGLTTINNNDDSKNIDNAQIDNDESKSDALDKLAAAGIGAKLGEKLGSAQESSGKLAEDTGLSIEAKGLEKEAKGLERAEKANQKRQAASDLRAKAQKDKEAADQKMIDGKSAMSSPDSSLGDKIRGAGTALAGKAQHAKSAAEIAAADRMDKKADKQTAKAEKMQRRGQTVQSVGQTIQKKGIEQQTNGALKQAKALDKQSNNLQNAQSKAEAKYANKAAKQNAVTAAGASARQQAEQLRSTRHSTAKAQESQQTIVTEAPAIKGATGKQNRAQQVQRAQASGGQPTGRKQSVLAAAKNGAKQGIAQSMANRSADGSIKQQFYQSMANTYSDNQRMTNYQQRMGGPLPASVQQRKQQQTQAPQVKPQTTQAPPPPVVTTTTTTTVVQQKPSGGNNGGYAQNRRQRFINNTVVQQQVVEDKKFDKMMDAQDAKMRQQKLNNRSVKPKKKK